MNCGNSFKFQVQSSKFLFRSAWDLEFEPWNLKPYPARELEFGT